VENCDSPQEQNPTPVCRDEEEEEGGIWALKPDPEPIGARMQGRRGPGGGSLTLPSAESPAREPIGSPSFFLCARRRVADGQAGDGVAWLELEDRTVDACRRRRGRWRPSLVGPTPREVVPVGPTARGRGRRGLI